MKELVECHSEYTYSERPIAIWWQNERLPILRIIQEARFPHGKYFRVSTQEEYLFDLFYEEWQDQWVINQV